MIAPLKEKYMGPQPFKRTPYRTRTGPRCCNVHCGSTRKKRAKAVKRAQPAR